MSKFYFTYGSEGHDFYGGWTEVMATDIDEAIRLFDIVHPRKTGSVACAGIYNEEDFKSTRMYENGNFGYYCLEKIELIISRFTGEEEPDCNG